MKVRFLHLPRVRISALFLFIAIFLYQNPVFAKTNRPERALIVQEITLIEAIHHIGEEYKVLFNYDRNIVSDITVRYEPEKFGNVDAAIASVLKETNLKYQIFSHRYVVIYKNDQEGMESLKEMIQHFQEIVDNREDIVLERQRLRPSPKLIRTLPQDVLVDRKIAFSIEGTVTDQEGEPLIGVNIQVKGTNMGTSTDIDGQFTLDDIDENAVLVVSYIGYQTQEVAVAGKSNLTIVLLSDSQLLDEVVVVGYGTQKKVNVIGSVTTISEEQITASPVSNVSSALTGRMPGLIAQQASGEPGSNQAGLIVRGTATLGNNSPLVIIDGIQGRDLNSINPSDIESISVLKDASAAIYGARAANGVILVTTKRGSESGSPTFNYRFYQGLQSPTDLPEMASAYDYASMIREVQSYRGIDESNMSFSSDDIEKYKSGEYPWTHPSTNWFDESLKKYSSVGSHNFSVNGGTEKINYYASFGTLHEDGIYTNSALSYKRYNLQASVDFTINEYLEVGMTLTGSKDNKNGSSRSAENIFSSAVRNFPTKHAIFPGTNLPGPDIEYGDQPIVTPSLAPGFSNNENFNSYNTLRAKVSIPGIEGLEVNAFYSYDKYVNKSKFLEKPFTLYSFDDAAYIAAGNTGVESGDNFLVPYTVGRIAEPQLTDAYGDGTNTSVNIRVNYNTSLFESHNIQAFAAYENGENYSQGISAFRRYFNSDRLPYLFAGGDAQKDNNGWASVDSRVNFISRINYDYLGKYLFQVGFRRDGSLRFSKENGRWGNFPSVLTGWRITEEGWWSNNVINEMKIKASWAKMGNDLVEPFQYLSSYSFGTGTVLGENALYSPALYEVGTPNPSITWEIANVYNFGVETFLFDYKWNFSADLFYERRKDILVKRNASVPVFTGIELPDENFGIVDNKGVEVVLGYNDEIGEFSYQINSTFSFARNSIIEYDEPERNVPWQVRTGLPQGAILVYKSEGIFRDEAHVESLPHVPGARPGDIIIRDEDGNGEITSDDRILIPLTTVPEISYGMNFNLSYRNFGLTFFIQGTENALRYVWPDNRQGTSGNYFKYDADGRWTPENTNASKPRAFERNEEYWRGSFETDYGYHKLGYARLKNVKLHYNLPSGVSDQIGIKGAQLHLSAQNLLLLYNKDPITDPEGGGSRNYPLMKTMAIGASLAF